MLCLLILHLNISVSIGRSFILLLIILGLFFRSFLRLRRRHFKDSFTLSHESINTLLKVLKFVAWVFTLILVLDFVVDSIKVFLYDSNLFVH